MRVIMLAIYKYGELNDDGKEKAREIARRWMAEDPNWLYEYEDTLKRFCEIFPVSWKSFDAEGNISFSITEQHEFVIELKGIRLLKYLHNNYYDYLWKPKYLGHRKGMEKFTPVYSRVQRDNCCVLTGFCADDAILKPIYDFMAKPVDNVDFDQLLRDCMHSFAYSWRDDYEGQLSDDYLADFIEANEYEFLESGKLSRF